MEKIKLAIVGCGGMGGRHLLGLQELEASGMGNVQLVAACDLRRDNAERLADKCGRSPRHPAGHLQRHGRDGKGDPRSRWPSS